MSIVEILEVRQHPDWGLRLRGCNIDSPCTAARLESATVEIAGWALGPDGPAAAIELIHGGEVFRRVPAAVHRPDVAAAFPDVPCAHAAGFTVSVAIVGEQEFQVRAVLRDQTRVPIAWMRARRHEHSGVLVSVVIP